MHVIAIGARRRCPPGRRWRRRCGGDGSGAVDLAPAASPHRGRITI